MQTNWWEVGALIGGSACTLLLALAAFITIRDGKRAQRAERRNQSLKEIVGWGVDIMGCEFFEVSELPPQASALEGSRHIEYLQSRESITALNTKARYLAVMARNAYVGTIAQQYDAAFNSDISQHVKLTNDALKAHLQLLDKAMRGQVSQPEYMKSWHALATKAEFLINQATIQLVK
jgi:hypothetical protein